MLALLAVGDHVCLSPDKMAGLNIHVVPLVVTFEGTSYREGVDVQPGEFYRLLAASDPGILSIRISSGLSGSQVQSKCLSTCSRSMVGVAYAPLAAFADVP